MFDIICIVVERKYFCVSMNKGWDDILLMYKCIYNKVIIGEGWNWNNRERGGGGGDEVFGMYENSCILFLVCYRLMGV